MSSFWIRVYTKQFDKKNTDQQILSNSERFLAASQIGLRYFLLFLGPGKIATDFLTITTWVNYNITYML